MHLKYLDILSPPSFSQSFPTTRSLLALSVYLSCPPHILLITFSITLPRPKFSSQWITELIPPYVFVFFFPESFFLSSLGSLSLDTSTGTNKNLIIGALYFLSFSPFLDTGCNAECHLCKVSTGAIDTRSHQRHNQPPVTLPINIDQSLIYLL